MTNLTHTDIDLAKIYFELLVAVAKEKPGQTIEYGELVTLAKNTYPDNEAVKGATAVSTGRRLGTLRDKFTNPNKLPDLSASACCIYELKALLVMLRYTYQTLAYQRSWLLFVRDYPLGATTAHLSWHS